MNSHILLYSILRLHETVICSINKSFCFFFHLPWQIYLNLKTCTDKYNIHFTFTAELRKPYHCPVHTIQKLTPMRWKQRVSEWVCEREREIERAFFFSFCHLLLLPLLWYNLKQGHKLHPVWWYTKRTDFHLRYSCLSLSRIFYADLTRLLFYSTCMSELFP